MNLNLTLLNFVRRLKTVKIFVSNQSFFTFTREVYSNTAR